jgi:hypothetical protein
MEPRLIRPYITNSKGLLGLRFRLMLVEDVRLEARIVKILRTANSIMKPYLSFYSFIARPLTIS